MVQVLVYMKLTCYTYILYTQMFKNVNFSICCNIFI